MDLLEEIRTGFANLRDGGVMLNIESLDPAYAAWVFREDAAFGVAVEIPDDLVVSERFAGSRLVTVDRGIHGATRHLLRLECSVQLLRNEFAVVCAQMLTPGEGGKLREALLADPLAWWESWRQLLGNAIANPSAYSVLGELLALERLLQRGENPEWRGPIAGTIDLDTTAAGYEVKSTISRYGSLIHVTGQFQLATSGAKKLYLVHQRFEPATAGQSINAVVDRLVEMGESREGLETLLSRCGLEAGCAARSEKFSLIESLLYEVDADFPRITQESFVGGVLPPGVVRIEYQIDLAGLAHEQF